MPLPKLQTLCLGNNRILDVGELDKLGGALVEFFAALLDVLFGVVHCVLRCLCVCLCCLQGFVCLKRFALRTFVSDRGSLKAGVGGESLRSGLFSAPQILPELVAKTEGGGDVGVVLDAIKDQLDLADLALELESTLRFWSILEAPKSDSTQYVKF